MTRCHAMSAQAGIGVFDQCLTSSFAFFALELSFSFCCAVVSFFEIAADVPKPFRTNQC
jgi:hypothetical protein